MTIKKVKPEQVDFENYTTVVSCLPKAEFTDSKPIINRKAWSTFEHALTFPQLLESIDDHLGKGKQFDIALFSFRVNEGPYQFIELEKGKADELYRDMLAKELSQLDSSNGTKLKIVYTAVSSRAKLIAFGRAFYMNKMDIKAISAAETAVRECRNNKQVTVAGKIPATAREMLLMLGGGNIRTGLLKVLETYKEDYRL